MPGSGSPLEWHSEVVVPPFMVPFALGIGIYGFCHGRGLHGCVVLSDRSRVRRPCNRQCEYESIHTGREDEVTTTGMAIG